MGRKKSKGGQVKGLGDAEASSVIYKYAFTNQNTKKRVVQMIKVNYDLGSLYKPADVPEIEVKNPADQDPAEVIEMSLSESKHIDGVLHYVFEGRDSSGNTYIVSISKNNSGDLLIQPSGIITKNGDTLIGKLWDKLSEKRWEKHTNKNSFTTPVVPASSNDRDELMSRCSTSNAFYTNHASAHLFSYTRVNCKNEKLSVFFSDNNLGKILKCLDKCSGEKFILADGSEYGFDCDSSELQIEYDQNGLKVTSKDNDGLVSIWYTEDC